MQIGISEDIFHVFSPHLRFIFILIFSLKCFLFWSSGYIWSCRHILTFSAWLIWYLPYSLRIVVYITVRFVASNLEGMDEW